MPMIIVKASTPISPAQEVGLKTKLGEAIALVPGKSEAHLMLAFEDNARLYYAGANDAPMAYVEVNCLGQSTREAYCDLTAAICGMLKDELGISPDKVYVKYDELVHWGWNSTNF